MKKTPVTFFLVMLFLAAPEVAFGHSTKLADNFCSQIPEAVATNVPNEGYLSPSLALNQRSAVAYFHTVSALA